MQNPREKNLKWKQKSNYSVYQLNKFVHVNWNLKKQTADEHTIDLHGAVLRFDDREQSIL